MKYRNLLFYAIILGISSCQNIEKGIASKTAEEGELNLAEYQKSRTMFFSNINDIPLTVSREQKEQYFHIEAVKDKDSIPRVMVILGTPYLDKNGLGKIKFRIEYEPSLSGYGNLRAFDGKPVQCEAIGYDCYESIFLFKTKPGNLSASKMSLECDITIPIEYGHRSDVSIQDATCKSLKPKDCIHSFATDVRICKLFFI